MNAKSFKHSVSASLLGLAILSVSSATHAGEYQLWREQVKTAPGERTVFTAAIGHARMPDYTMWREQRNKNATVEEPVVYTAKMSLSPYQARSDYRLWREQVQPASQLVIENMALRRH